MESPRSFNKDSLPLNTPNMTQDLLIDEDSGNPQERAGSLLVGDHGDRQDERTSVSHQGNTDNLGVKATPTMNTKTIEESVDTLNLDIQEETTNAHVVGWQRAEASLKGNESQGLDVDGFNAVVLTSGLRTPESYVAIDEPHPKDDVPQRAEMQTLPIIFDHAEFENSTLKLVSAIRPEWATAPGTVKIVRFTDGIMNTVSKSSGYCHC